MPYLLEKHLIMTLITILYRNKAIYAKLQMKSRINMASSEKTANNDDVGNSRKYH